MDHPVQDISMGPKSTAFPIEMPLQPHHIECKEHCENCQHQCVNADHWWAADRVLRHQGGVRRQPRPHRRRNAALAGGRAVALHRLHRTQDFPGMFFGLSPIENTVIMISW